MAMQKEDVGEPEGVTDIDSNAPTITGHGLLGKVLLALSLAGGPIILFVLRKFGR